MKIILIGDPASGKTTFLKQLKNNLYNIHYEKLSSELHIDIYNNLVLKNVNYGLYFFERDYKIWRDKKISFLEYTHHATYSFIRAHERSGKISRYERETIDRVLDQLSILMPISKNDIILHFICDYSITSERLKKRPPHMMKKEAEYINYLRNELQKNFQKRCKYNLIDTTNLTPQKVRDKIKEILPWIKYKKIK